LKEFPEKTAQSAVLGANLNGKTPPAPGGPPAQCAGYGRTAAKAFLQGSH